MKIDSQRWPDHGQPDWSGLEVDVVAKLRKRAVHLEIEAEESRKPRALVNTAALMRRAADMLESKAQRIRALEAALAAHGGAA